MLLVMHANEVLAMQRCTTQTSRTYVKEIERTHGLSLSRACHAYMNSSSAQLVSLTNLKISISVHTFEQV